MNNNAKQYFIQAITLMPFVIDYKIKYGTFLLNIHQIELASAVFQNALKLNPTVKELHLNLGYIDILNEQYLLIYQCSFL